MLSLAAKKLVVYNKKVTKGVLLDVDGTLVLSNDAHARSWVEAFARFGYEIRYRDVRKFIGMGGDKLIPKLVPSLNSESGTGKDISEFRSELFLQKYGPKLKSAPGSRKLVERMLGAGIRLMVASSASAKTLEALLEAAQVNDLLNKATTSDDADKSKPDPDIVHAALEKIGLPPDQVVMIGDTPYDIEAAGTAGVRLIAVRCGGWKDEDLAGATAIYDDPADVLDNYENMFS